MDDNDGRIHKILLLDDEENILNSLVRLMRSRKNWECEACTSPSVALNRVQCTIYEVIISDLKMPEMDGIQFLREAHEYQPDAQRILLTGFVDPESLMDAINEARVFGFITKPWDDKQLLDVIDRAIEQRNMLFENRMLAKQVKEQAAELQRHKELLQSQKQV